MADPYIDPYEAKAYGKFACEQMSGVLIGKIPALDGMLEWALNQQLLADTAISDVLDKLPKPAPPLDSNDVLEEARDTIVRFGAHLERECRGLAFDAHERRLVQRDKPPRDVASDGWILELILPTATRREPIFPRDALLLHDREAPREIIGVVHDERRELCVKLERDAGDRVEGLHGG